jgi:hypothetical protein
MSSTPSLGNILESLFGPLADRSIVAHEYLISAAGQPIIIDFLRRLEQRPFEELIQQTIQKLAGGQLLLQPLSNLLDAATAFNCLQRFQPQALDLKREVWRHIDRVIATKVSETG